MAALLARLIAAQRSGGAAAEVPLGCLARLQRALGAQDIVPDAGRGSVAAVPGLVEQLTSRELEVLEMLAAGRSNQAIAEPARGHPRHREEARQPRPGQARRGQPHRGRRPRTRAQPDPLTSERRYPGAPSWTGAAHHRRSEKILNPGRSWVLRSPPPGASRASRDTSAPWCHRRLRRFHRACPLSGDDRRGRPAYRPRHDLPLASAGADQRGSASRARQVRLTWKERSLMTTAHHERSAIGAMYAGLGLTVVAMIVPYVDHATGQRAGRPHPGRLSAPTPRRASTRPSPPTWSTCPPSERSASSAGSGRSGPSRRASGGPAGPRPRCSCSAPASP